MRASPSTPWRPRCRELAARGEEGRLREAVLRFSREVAFAAAQVYARTAEERGAWDARLEALVVDALLSDDPGDELAGRAAALGWRPGSPAAVLATTAPPGDPEPVLDALTRHARAAGLDALAGVRGEHLLLVLGTDAPLAPPPDLLLALGEAPVVAGPAVADLGGARHSAREALAGLRAVAGRREMPRPVDAQDLLPERALAGDGQAAHQLVEGVYKRLESAGSPLLATVETYVELGGALEATARALYVHPNTVRYRLGKAEQACGLHAGDPRDAYVLRVALTLGRLAGSS